MAFFNNKRKDFSIQPPKQEIANGAFTVTDSPNIDFTYASNNLTADLTLTGVTAGTYGDATNVASVTVDIFGRITGVTLIPISGGGGGITGANNGLINNSGTVQLGGTTLGTGNLIRNTFISNDGYIFRIDQTIGNALYLNTVSGTGVTAIVGTGIAVRARATSGNAIEGISYDDYSLSLGRETAGVSDVVGLIKAQRGTTGSAFSGLGGAFEIWVEHRNTMPAPSPTIPTATFEGIWANPGPLVADRVGKFRIRLDEADVQKDILSGLATGEVYCDRYGSGTFTGTATHYAAWDASGKLIEEPIPGGGGVPDIAIYPYMVATYLGDINPLDIHVSAAEDRLYLPANSTGTIKFYEASTNVYRGSVALSNVGSCFYIESTGELWATNLSNGIINRYNASAPGGSLGTIAGSGTRGLDHIEYSSTKVFISNFTSNSVTVANPSTNTIDATINSASLGGTGMAGMVYVDNPLSDHDGLIAVILRTTNEVALIDPATNTVVAAGVNPSSKLSSPVYIAYDIATDQYFITNASGNNISVLAPASATTFTHVKNIDGIINPFGIVSDETTGLVYVCFGSNNFSTTNGVVSVAVIDPSTNSIARTIMTLGYNSSTITVYNIDIDSTNGYIYVNGYSGAVGNNIATKLKIR
jgi:hypothetical protein